MIEFYIQKMLNPSRTSKGESVAECQALPVLLGMVLVALLDELNRHLAHDVQSISDLPRSITILHRTARRHGQDRNQPVYRYAMIDPA
jgi:hypothetical protein